MNDARGYAVLKVQREYLLQNDSLHHVERRRWDSIYNRFLSERVDFNAVVSRLTLNLQDKDAIIAIKDKEIRQQKKAARKQKWKIIGVAAAVLGGVLLLK